MTLHVEFKDEELPDLKALLLRALNTWEPRSAPKWAYELDAAVDARLLKIQESQNAHGRPGHLG